MYIQVFQIQLQPFPTTLHQCKYQSLGCGLLFFSHNCYSTISNYVQFKDWLQYLFPMDSAVSFPTSVQTNNQLGGEVQAFIYFVRGVLTITQKQALFCSYFSFS